MNYFSQWPELRLLRQDETTVPVGEALKDAEYVILFFGAPWNDRYKNLIPKMKALYDNHHEGKKFEVILIVRGDTEEELLTDFYSTNYKGTKGAPAADDGDEALKKRKKDDDAGVAEGTLVAETEEFFSLPMGVGAEPKQVKRVGHHGDYFMLDPNHSDVVGTPLLYHLKVASYPGVVVINNKPSVPDPTGVVPLPAPREKGEQAEVRPARSAVGPRPTISDERCAPSVITTSGCYFMEHRDPEAKEFPWPSMTHPEAARALLYVMLFTAVASIAFGVLLVKNPWIAEALNRFFRVPIFVKYEKAPPRVRRRRNHTM